MQSDHSPASTMGKSASKLRAEIKEQNDETKRDLVERLQILEKMVDSRLQIQHQQILAGERGDQQIHSGTIVESFKQVNIVLESSTDDIEGGISDFFTGHIMSGLGKLVGLGIKSVLENAYMGEYETTQMLIVWNHNALLRYDAYCYRWNFSSTNIITDTQGVVGILLCKRVIDLTTTDPQVLTWAISRQAKLLERESEEKQMIDEAMEVLKNVVQFQAELKKVQLELGMPPGISE